MQPLERQDNNHQFFVGGGGYKETDVDKIWQMTWQEPCKTIETFIGIFSKQVTKQVTYKNN